MVTPSHPLLAQAPLTVGAISEPEALGLELNERDSDWVELRLDSLGGGTGVADFAARCPLPVLLTARHPEEGGAGGLDAGTRETLLRDLLGEAAAVDVELRSLEELGGLWKEAGERTLVRIASFHDFDGTPPLADLQDRIAAAEAAGATVAKLAFRINAPRDLETILALFESPAPLPLSVMGMGPLAPSSRLLAAQLGSVLNYGFLGSAPTAPGQWPAQQLKRVLAASRV